MTNAAQINSERQLCHDPEGGGRDQPLVGEVLSQSAKRTADNNPAIHRWEREEFLDEVREADD